LLSVVINEKLFQSLSADLQDAVVRAGKETTKYLRWYSDAYRNEKFKLSLKSKPNIVFCDLKDESEFIERAKSIWPKFYKTIGKGDEAKGEKILKSAVNAVSGKIEKMPIDLY
jgi:TRAP-type C4-dicarboxylate transport system substrate-binding protein